MKIVRKLLMLMLVILVAFVVTACDEDDGDKRDSEDSKTTLKKSATFSDPEELVNYYITAAEQLDNDQETLKKQCQVYSNETALKELDMYDEDKDDSLKTTWEIKKTKEYKEDDGVTDGVKAFIHRRGGDEDQVQGAAITEVSITIETDGEKKDKYKSFYTSVKISGKWYIIDCSSADSLNDLADKWSDLR